MSIISVEKAFKRVQDVEKISKRDLKSMKLRTSVEQDGRDMMFIFHDDNNIIFTPADDDLSPVLGKCTKASGDMPPALIDWLSTYSEEIKWFQEGGKEKLLAAESNIEPEGGTGEAGDQLEGEVNGVAPLTTSTWGQRWPFNKYCKFDGTYSKTGCPAIAVGQLMYYWAKKGYRRGCVATEEYTSEKGKYTYKIGAVGNYTYFDYKNIIDGTPVSTANIEAVAKLLRSVGRAMKTNYSPNGSSADMRNIKDSLIKSFKLTGTYAEYLQSSIGETEFRNKIIEDLKKGWPVLMYGANAQKDATGAHIFICDGWDATTNKFRMNWGWFGDYNGWYDLTALSKYKADGSRIFELSFQRRIITKVHPSYYLGDVNNDGRINISDLTSIINTKISGQYNGRADINNDGVVDSADIERENEIILNKDIFDE